LSFPDIQKWPADKDFVAFGASLNTDFVISAYRKGIFPWPDPEYPEVIWASPKDRGILELDFFHLGKSDRRHLRKIPFHVTFNEAFEKVILECAQIKRPEQHGTWITEGMLSAYTELHKKGFAHSVEAWLNGELVGGLYGVCVDKIFSAESMFHKTDYASKAALNFLVARLKQLDFKFLDVQVVTPVMNHMGARLIPRSKFLTLLKLHRVENFQLSLK